MTTPLRTGTIVARRYEIIELIGCGGMADVYRARHLALGNDVALKILTKITARRSVRFEREARTAASLDHVGCVKVHDYGHALRNGRYLAMELIGGDSLRRIMESEGTFTPEHAMWIGREMLDALAHAHSRGVLHRDIKPENVMFRTDGSGRRLVLIDFGLSRLRDDAPLTASGVCVGSPSYIAPERLLHQPYDGRADVYSIGVLLYELLAGCRPFYGESPLEIARSHIEDEPYPLDVLREDLPQPLIDVIERAIARRPEDRYASAVDMLAALERARRDIREARVVTPTPLPPADDPLADDAAETMMRIYPPRQSMWKRLTGWLRFGRWRWREPSAETSLTSIRL